MHTYIKLVHKCPQTHQNQNRRNQNVHQPTNRYTKCGISTHLTIYRNEVLMYATLSMNPESFKWKKLDTKDTYCITPLIWNVQNSKLIKMEDGLVKPRTGEIGEEWGWLQKHIRFLFKVVKIFRNWLWWQLFNSVKILNCILNVWGIWYINYTE